MRVLAPIAFTLLLLALAFCIAWAIVVPAHAQEADEDVVDPQVECIIMAESGGLDVPNHQGSGAAGPGQYMPSTWRAHTAEMGMPWLDIHSLTDVRHVMSYDLMRGRRSQWTVYGC